MRVLYSKTVRHLLASLRPLAVMAAVVALVAVAPTQAIVSAQGKSERQRHFAAAAQEFGVPEPLLLAYSYNQTRWEDHKGQPSVNGGYGLMHLTGLAEVEDGRGRPEKQPTTPRVMAAKESTLTLAADILGVSEKKLINDEAQNIRGGAAVLAAYAKQDLKGVPTALGDWSGAVARMSGIERPTQAVSFVESVHRTLAKGATITTQDGQLISLKAEKAEPNRSLLPKVIETMEQQPQTECPPTITCKFEAARFAQNNPSNPADYGNYDTANRPHDTKPKYIVIHDTEGSYESAISWFQDPRSYVAAHYVIRSSDGEVTQMIQNKDIGWHAGNWYMNMHSIGIEHEGYAAEGAAWYTEEMYQSSAKLVRYLAKKYDIPMDRKHIVGHDQYHGLTPARAKLMHHDPGPFWDWDHYMNLLHGRDFKKVAGAKHSVRAEIKSESKLRKSHDWPTAPSITISPSFEWNKQLVTKCDAGACEALPAQGTNFVYLRQEPRHDAPLLNDIGLKPEGGPSTTEVGDWGARATHGQTFMVAEQRGDWTAIWFSGQKGWFFNPSSWLGHTSMPAWTRSISPKAGKATIPVYGRPVPEPGAYKNGVPPLTPVPLQYTISAGQRYPAYESSAVNDYYYVSTFDRSAPGDGTMVVGNERYIPIEYNHRQAFVKASDVEMRWW